MLNTNKLAVLCFLGMGAIAYGQSTNPYEGRVGINTKTPQATIQVKATEANLAGTTNEGMMAPQLSKTRVAAIATPVEGTLVYVTNETTSPITAYTGADLKVAKIDEKGYYFYNGTEWVKVGADSQIWQKQATGEVKLVDSYLNSNVAYYENGVYRNLPVDLDRRKSSSYTYLNNTTNQVTTVDYTLNNVDAGNSVVLNVGYADKVPQNYVGADGNSDKYLNYNHLIVDEKSSVSKRIVAQKNRVESNINFNQNLSGLYGAVNLAEHFGTGKVSVVYGAYNSGVAQNSGTATRIVGAYNEAINYTNNPVGAMEGTVNFLSVRDGNAQKVTNAYLTHNHLYLTNSNTDINNVQVTRNAVTIAAGYTGKITTLVGLYNGVNIADSYTGLTNMYGARLQGVTKGQSSNYGLYIDDVGNTTATKNYSIYTGTGNVRIGDLKGTGSRPVYANADGVLIAGGDTSIKIGDTPNIECNDANRGTMNFRKDVTTTNGETSDAFAVCLKGSDGYYYWRYIYGAGGVTNGVGAFGTGL